MTQAEFARQNGWSRQYVNKLVKQGRIEVKGGRIDPVAAKKAIEELAEPSTVLRQSNPSRGEVIASTSYPVG